ncbi:MAG: hypothetical protein L3J12_10290 [Spirochaetales bacterium]|nr:hypothetical protein [Spirochaetales bacterium]
MNIGISLRTPLLSSIDNYIEENREKEKRFEITYFEVNNISSNLGYY